MYIKLHLINIGRKYIIVININVLSNELKYKFFKKIINNAAPLNFISYLFIKNILRQFNSA